MKKILSFAVFTLFGNLLYSQQANIKWGFESKSEMTFVSYVNGNGSDMIKLSFQEETGIRFVIGGQKKITPVLTRYNEKAKELNSREIVVDEKGIYFNDLLSVKNKLFLFSNQYDKSSKSTSFYAQELDMTTLNSVGGVQNLGAFDAINKRSQSTVGYELSRDSSHILMFGLSPKSNRDNEKYYMAVYDNNMKKQWENTVTLPYKDKYITVLERLVTNEGKVGIIIKHYDQEVSREAITKDGTKVPSYVTKLLLYENGKTAPSEFILNLGDKFIHTISLTEDVATSLQLFGLYKSKYNGYITGYFIADINKQSGQVSTSNVVNFPEELVTLVKKDKQGSDRERDPGIANNFELVQVEETADGTKHYLVEYAKSVFHPGSYSTNNSYSSPPYWEHFTGDIIAISIRKDNKNVLTRIPKMQISIDTKVYSSFKALPYNNKLVIFYNDNEDNVDRDLEKKPDEFRKFNKSMLVMAVVDEKGNFVRNTLLTHRDMRLTTAVKQCRLLDKKRIGLMAQKGAGLFTAARDMPGVLELK